jgi:hypothetical protein
MGEFDRLRLLADSAELMEKDRGKTPIAEVAFDASLGVWRYFFIRSDKSVPNYVDTVMGFMMEMAENMRIEELEYCLLARSEAEKDFGAQTDKMFGKLLDWQRKRCGSVPGRP